MTKFSIVIPVYNVENEIRQCLDSLKNQTYRDFEVLLVDDCGNDSSVDIVQEYASQDVRFKLLRHEHNKGVSAARNTALDAASGEFLVFVDSDDWLEVNALEVINNAFEKSQADAVWYGLYRCSGNERIPAEGDDVDQMFYATESAMEKLVGFVWNKAYRLSLIKELGIKFPEGLIIEDSEFTFRTFVNLKKCYYINDRLYNYRVNRTGSYTTEDNKIGDRISDELKILERMYDYLQEKNLFNEYKNFLLYTLGRIIKKVTGIAHRREYVINEANNLLNKMNFPEAFSDIEEKIILSMN